jgi:hypothetical protein
MQNTSLLIAGVPLKKGTPEHIETFDDFAATTFDSSGKVHSVHTPQTPLQRVHEQMHARHTDQKRVARDFADVPDTVRQITEDCRIHLLHWPWHPNETPQFVSEDCQRQINAELKAINAIRDDKTKRQNAWGDFGTRLRAAAVRAGLSGDCYTEVRKAGFRTSEQAFADHVISLLLDDNAAEAAEALAAAFFADYKPPESERKGKSRKGASGKGKSRKGGRGRRGAGGCARHYTMDIIELPHTVAIPSAEVGYRLTTSGPRMYRPALRRPVLSGRMFLRRSPSEPGGTVLIDASGSMGEFSEVERWANAEPFATVAYYAGQDSGFKGWLYVYARNGFRAAHTVCPRDRGNLVDGKALDWLLQQDGPRYLITDREFCGAADSEAQRMRLALLERSGEVIVKDYRRAA